MESDPSVSSTVVESELSLQSPLMEELDDDDVYKAKLNKLGEDNNRSPENRMKPSWHFVSQDCASSSVSVTVEGDTYSELSEIKLQELQNNSYYMDFEVPEMEFDEFSMELAGAKSELSYSI